MMATVSYNNMQQQMINPEFLYGTMHDLFVFV